jgi:hypothetical protein
MKICGGKAHARRRDQDVARLDRQLAADRWR